MLDCEAEESPVLIAGPCLARSGLSRRESRLTSGDKAALIASVADEMGLDFGYGVVRQVGVDGIFSAAGMMVSSALEVW